MFELVFRVLTAGEWLEVYDAAARHPSRTAEELAVSIEALARGIVTINGRTLSFSASEKEKVLSSYNEYYGTKKKDLSPVECATIYLQDKFLLHHIKLFDTTMAAWMSEIIQEIDFDIKKKRNRAGPGMTQSDSVSDSTSSLPTPDS